MWGGIFGESFRWQNPTSFHAGCWHPERGISVCAIDSRFSLARPEGAEAIVTSYFTSYFRLHASYFVLRNLATCISCDDTVGAGSIVPYDAGEIGTCEVGSRKIGAGKVGEGEIRASEIHMGKI